MQNFLILVSPFQGLVIFSLPENCCRKKVLALLGGNLIPQVCREKQH